MAEITQDLGKVSITVKGAWSSSTAYEILDVVTSGGGSYIAKQAVPAGTALTNTSYWIVLTEKGAKGDTGNTGPQGPTGNGIASISKTGTSGNVDTYTITYTDETTTTFTVTNGAVTSVDGLTGAVELDYKANIDGYYAGLTSGTTEQVLSNVKATDAEPYVYRTAGGSLNIGDREEKTIVGASVVWGQLVQNGDFSDGTTGWTARQTGGFSVVSGEGVLAVTGNNNNNTIYSGVSAISGHKYLVRAKLYIDADSSIKTARIALSNNYTEDAVNAVNVTTTKTEYAAILTPAGTPNRLTINVRSSGTLTVGDKLYIDDVTAIDLTAMFGSSIADRAYTLEQATAGSGVAWLQSYGFFTKPYYAYTASPSLQSVKVSAHETIAYNQWDEEWELGGIDSTTGAKDSTTNKIRSKNYIPVVANTEYYFNKPSGKTMVVYFYDGNNGYISYSQVPTGNILTIPTNCAYILFRLETGYGTTYNNDICISLYWDGERAGEYEAYNKHEYPFDSSVELRGVYKLDSNNKIYADGDKYHNDGTIDRNYEERAYQSGDEELANAVTDGTNTVVKLTTPTTETADPFQSPMIVDDWGTERFVDAEYEAGNRDFEMPVGHVTKYPINIRAKVETAPDSPNGDGDYIVRQTNGQNAYVPLEIPNELPTAPSEDGVYTLKVTVSDGVATYSWEA